MITSGNPKEQEINATVALMGPIEAQYDAREALAKTYMDKPNPHYDSLREASREADRRVNRVCMVNYMQMVTHRQML